jgi:type II secretory ATPase GspE/PulE/Tfp pilus assembly ATPase PilB-like protein
VSEKPITRFVLLILFQAQQDGATEITFTRASDPPAIRYKVDGAWYEFATPPLQVAADAMIELRRLANLTEGATKSIIDTSYSGTTLRWNVAVADVEDTFVLTPFAGNNRS